MSTLDNEYLEENLRSCLQMPLAELFHKYPFVKTWLSGLDFPCHPEQSFPENLESLEDDWFLQQNTDRETLEKDFRNYFSGIFALFHKAKPTADVITVYPGTGKDGTPETFESIVIKKGETVALVGATGSGKSRFLEDIEWQADGDTPTGRKVLINGKSREENRRTEQRRLIAQLSQNMNFVLDMSVEEFLKMHADCFSHQETAEELTERVFSLANELSGEPFARSASVTNLSGGQSRALMIADCAVLSDAPVILIDEIENAGIDRRKAMKILGGRDKIVFIATHDPVLALLADKRLIINGGRVAEVINRSGEEEEALRYAEELDRILTDMRKRLRRGERLTGYGAKTEDGGE